MVLALQHVNGLEEVDAFGQATTTTTEATTTTTTKHTSKQ
jgi:hypothetical protein